LPIFDKLSLYHLLKHFLQLQVSYNNQQNPFS
jgi:hypothetical protein